MTKRGSQDNIVTYEHICDTSADMVNIDPNYITLGSICIVINGEDGGMEVYMANSNKEWNSIAMGAGSGDSGSGASSLMDLLDVEVLNPTDGQTLTYDATTQKWINGGGGSTGGVMFITIQYDESKGAYVSDKTWSEITAAVENGYTVYAGEYFEGLSGIPYDSCTEIDISNNVISNIVFSHINVSDSDVVQVFTSFHVENDELVIGITENTYQHQG